ncbi:hypothetical protein [Ensifer soli]|uniref:hypothetical protein n=1 Tax=Ciceribacter sp. sgz301302 TaxID=3342379 RepID=UPI0035BB0C93
MLTTAAMTVSPVGSAGACTISQTPDYTRLRKATVILRAEIMSYTRRSPEGGAILGLRTLETLHGGPDRSRWTALWNLHSDGPPSRWTTSQRVILGLTVPSEEDIDVAMADVVQQHCTSYFILADTSEHREIVLTAIGPLPLERQREAARLAARSPETIRQIRLRAERAARRSREAIRRAFAMDSEMRAKLLHVDPDQHSPNARDFDRQGDAEIPRGNR